MGRGFRQMQFLTNQLIVVALTLVAACNGDGGGSIVPPQGPSWGTAVLIQYDNSRDAMLPQIAMNDAGVAIAVWMQSDIPHFNIWANRFDGVSWGTAEMIETDDAGDAMLPQIAMDDTGAAIAVWRQNDGTRNNIWANRFDGVSWGTAEMIETDDTGDATLPQIAMDGTGAAIAVWTQNDDNSVNLRANIWANRFDGSSWGAPELVETNSTSLATLPQIAIDGTGAAIAVWHQWDTVSGLGSIWANRFDGSSWSTPEVIETDDARDASNPQIAMDGTGNAVAVWYQGGVLLDNIWANQFQ